MVEGQEAHVDSRGSDKGVGRRVFAWGGLPPNNWWLWLQGRFNRCTHCVRGTTAVDPRALPQIIVCTRVLRQEDTVLAQVIQDKLTQLGTDDDELISPVEWKAISLHLSDRSGKQCRERCVPVCAHASV